MEEKKIEIRVIRWVYFTLLLLFQALFVRGLEKCSALSRYYERKRGFVGFFKVTTIMVLSSVLSFALYYFCPFAYLLYYLRPYSLKLISSSYAIIYLIYLEVLLMSVLAFGLESFIYVFISTFSLKLASSQLSFFCFSSTQKLLILEQIILRLVFLSDFSLYLYFSSTCNDFVCLSFVLGS